MTEYWWKDLFDRNNNWQGLEFTIRAHQGVAQAMDMLSGHHGRMALQLHGETLFWASMLKDHSGVWLVFNVDHSGRQSLVPPVTSADVEQIKCKGAEVWTGEWCRYFTRQLMNTPVPLLPPHRWLLRPVDTTRPCNQSISIENWRFDSPESTGNIGCDWTLYGEDIPDLTNPEKIRLVDWWWGGNLLLGRYHVHFNAGRLKWWRKKCREETLPPILVWYIAGLGSFVILDGHYRLQAAIEEGTPPSFLVLSELNERNFPVDQEHQARITRALERQSQNPGCSIDGVNQTLINLYDNRYLYASTYSRAILGKGESWAADVNSYLHKHNLEEYLDKIVNRVND